MAPRVMKPTFTRLRYSDTVEAVWILKGSILCLIDGDRPHQNAPQESALSLMMMMIIGGVKDS